MSTARSDHQLTEESYLARACRLVADHRELFRPEQPAPRILRVLPPPAPRKPRTRRSRQLNLRFPPTMRR